MTQQDEGEGMRMTLEERIEAMVAEMVRRPEVGDDIGEALWRGAQSVARQYLAAAFPELFASPPEAWLAPWEPTPEIADALIARTPTMRESDFEVREAYEEQWRAARDAHLQSKEFP